MLCRELMLIRIILSIIITIYSNWITSQSPQSIAETLINIVGLFSIHLCFSYYVALLFLPQIMDLALELAVISIWKVWVVQFVLEPKLLHESPKLLDLLTGPLLVFWTHCEVELNEYKIITYANCNSTNRNMVFGNRLITLFPSSINHYQVTV